MSRQPILRGPGLQSPPEGAFVRGALDRRGSGSPRMIARPRAPPSVARQVIPHPGQSSRSPLWPSAKTPLHCSRDDLTSAKPMAMYNSPAIPGESTQYRKARPAIIMPSTNAHDVDDWKPPRHRPSPRLRIRAMAPSALLSSTRYDFKSPAPMAPASPGRRHPKSLARVQCKPTVSSPVPTIDHTSAAVSSWVLAEAAGVHLGFDASPMATGQDAPRPVPRSCGGTCLQVFR